MIEATVEEYLTKRVKAMGGEVRKVVFPGRRHAPDRLVMVPHMHWSEGLHFFVELKRPKAKPCAGQLREHERLRRFGFVVLVLDSKEAIDEWLASL